MEKNAKKIIASAEKLPNGKKLTDNYGALKALAQSEDVKKLVSKMNGEEISALWEGNGADAAEKLKKLLCEKKISLKMRSKLPIFYDADGIVWIPLVALRDGEKKAENQTRITLFYN